MNVSFTQLVASRGWHYYGKHIWRNPKQGEVLEVQFETDKAALQVDPHSIAWTIKNRAKLIPEVVGHIPMEISRFVYYFLRHGGKVSATVKYEKYRASPIPKGGLEIVIQATFSIGDDKKEFLERLLELIKNNYQSPDTEVVAVEDDDLLSVDDDDEDITLCMVDDEDEEQ